MSATHTPGPWHVADFDEPLVEDGIVCEAPSWGEVRPEPKTKLGSAAADLRLIAAAPDLLDELKSLRRAYVNLMESGRDRIISLGGQCDDVQTMEASDPNLRSSGAAINKATGSQHERLHPKLQSRPDLHMHIGRANQVQPPEVA